MYLHINKSSCVCVVGCKLWNANLNSEFIASNWNQWKKGQRVKQFSKACWKSHRKTQSKRKGADKGVTMWGQRADKQISINNLCQMQMCACVFARRVTMTPLRSANDDTPTLAGESETNDSVKHLSPSPSLGQLNHSKRFVFANTMRCLSTLHSRQHWRAKHSGRKSTITKR